MERSFNICLNRLIIIMLSLVLMVVFVSCGGQSSSSNNDNTGSYAVTLQWPEDVSTMATSYSSVRPATVDCTAAGIVTVTFTFYDENENYLIDDEWSCSLHMGTVEGIPAGSNRHLVIQGKDASGTVLYKGEKFGITITAGQTTEGGVLEMVAVVVQKWAKTYGGVATESIDAIQELSGGGYIVAGRTDSFSAGGDIDIWILKLNADGSIAWQKSYGGSSDDYFGDVILQTADGGYITTGYTASFGDWVEVAWILKLNADGTIAWQKTYGDYWQEIDAILETSDGGYLAAGHADIFKVEWDDGDLWIMKLDANGNVSWQYTYTLDFSEESVKSLIPATDGGYIVAGQIDEDGSDIWIVKIDTNGNIVWQKTYGNNNESIGHIQPTADGGYIVIGSTYSFGAGGQDAWLLKLNVDGTIAWQKTYGDEYNNNGEGIVQTADGGYMAVGRTGLCDDSIPPYESCYEIAVVKLESDGSIAWQKAYGDLGTGNEDTNGIIATADGGYIVAGKTDSFGAGSEDLWILKMDSDGAVGTADCPVSNLTGTEVTNTAVTGVDTDAPRATYDGPTADTTVTPQSTSGEVDTQCE